MSSPEALNIFPPNPENRKQERGFGTLREVLDWLMPPTEHQQQDLEFLSSRDRELAYVTQLMAFLEKALGQASLRGSWVKKLISGVPRGWNEPRKTIQQLIQNNPSKEFSCLQPIIRGGTDLDMLFYASHEQFITAVRQALKDCAEIFPDFPMQYIERTFASRVFVTLTFPTCGLQLDLGTTPITVADRRQDARYGPAIALGDALTTLSLMNGKISGSNGLNDFLTCTGAISEVVGCDPSIVLIGLLRGLLNLYWWADDEINKTDKERGEQLVLRRASKADFWQEILQNTLRVEYCFDQRANEIRILLVLLCLTNPHDFHNKLNTYHLKQFLPEWSERSPKKIGMEYHEYQKAFRSGTLGHDQNGLQLFADSMSVPVDHLVNKILLPSCKPRVFDSRVNSFQVSSTLSFSGVKIPPDVVKDRKLRAANRPKNIPPKKIVVATNKPPYTEVWKLV